MKGRASNKQIIVVSNSMAGKPIDITPRNDGDAVVWNEADQVYKHEERALVLVQHTAAIWTTINPVMKSGQEGYETDTHKRKVGDGVTAWNDLEYDTATGTGTEIGNIDGGRANEVYTLDQNIIGGDVNGN